MMRKDSWLGDENKDRRRFARILCSRAACTCLVTRNSYQTEFGERKKHSALLSNISVNGISFETDFRPPDGERMSFEVRPIEGPDLSAQIKVLHSRSSSKDGFYVIGSQFAEMGEGDKQSLLVLLNTIQRMEQDMQETSGPLRLP